MKTKISLIGLLVGALLLHAETHFIEAEDFKSETGGWKVVDLRSGSSVKALQGASGDREGIATYELKIDKAGRYRIWGRYLHSRVRKGPFDLTLKMNGEVLGRKTFDVDTKPDIPRGECAWDFLDANLPAGQLSLELSKFENKNCSGYARKVDCFLITDDLEAQPNHLDYGPQTYLRATIGEGYEEPVYVHIFANRFRRPYYAHYYMAADGIGKALRPKNKGDRLGSGERTPWCNITPMLYQDSGALLKISLRHAYGDQAARLRVILEFATAPHDGAIVHLMDIDNEPNLVAIAVPPNLLTDENRQLLKSDMQFSSEAGAIADSFDWPQFGKKPEHFPFFLEPRIDAYDRYVVERERKTLNYFGFLNFAKARRFKPLTWRHKLNDSYCQPDLTGMTNAVAKKAQELRDMDLADDSFSIWMMADEPGGQSLEFMARDQAYQTAFKKWLRKNNVTPAQLMVDSWADVRTVLESEKTAHPALYYYSQRFRTRALGDFMSLQRRLLMEATGKDFPAVVNFSDGPVFSGNFYSQGVDYFELMDDDGQNAIWGEDWANLSSTYQCGAYNVDLMRAAARDRKQFIGHLLVGYAGRRPLDIKLKAIGNLARGVKAMRPFHYGPAWTGHEGGPTWRSSAWQNKPEVWRAHAEILREIGAVEDLLLPAMPARAEVALLYSSASDIWTVGKNLAYGFDRMNTWLALVHAQIPVDIVSERQVAAGVLKGYRVCYLSGPNLQNAAASELVDWVRQGGTLFATAEAGARDEFDQHSDTLTSIMPAARGDLVTSRAHLSAGRYLTSLPPKDKIKLNGRDTLIDVLSVFQPLIPKEESAVIALNSLEEVAWVKGVAGQGTVYQLGFLPALDYVRSALIAKRELIQQIEVDEELLEAIDGPDANEGELARGSVTAEDRQRLEQSLNPWRFPGDIREAILMPVRESAVTPPIVCDVPLVDAVYMEAPGGVLIPLANYTLLPLEKVHLSVKLPRKPRSISSAHYADVEYVMQRQGTEVRCDFALPLESTDFIAIRF